MWPVQPGLPPFGDPSGGCANPPFGQVVGPIIAPAIYWTPHYDVLRQPGKGWMGPTAPVGGLLETPALGRQCPGYWHVACFALEKQFATDEAQAAFSADRDPTEQLGAMRGAHPSSQLKLQISWPTAQREQRYVIADIGTGLDVIVGPTQLVRADLLIPNPETVTVPAGLNALANESTAAVVTIIATPVAAGATVFNGRYTQTRLTSGTITDEIPRFARWVEVYTAPAVASATPGPAPGAVTVDFIFDELASAPGVLAPVGRAGVYPPPTGPFVSTRIPIPQNAKLISIQSGVEQLVTLVYGLSI